MAAGRLLSNWEAKFSGAMLNFQGVPFGGSSGGMTTTDITQWASHITSFTKALRICDFTLSIGTSCSCRRLPRQPATQLFDILMGHSPSINHYIVEKNPLSGYYQNIPWRVHKQRSLYITNPKSAQWRGKSLKFTTFLHCLIHPIWAMSWSQSENLIWQNSPQTWRTQHQAHKKLEVKQNKTTHTQHGWLLVFLQIPQGISQTSKQKKTTTSPRLLQLMFTTLKVF